MAVETLLPVAEYLETSYSPDREYRDGVLVERNVGDKKHARLQAKLTMYLGRHEEQWNIEVYTELRVRVRDKWYPIPDVCVYALPDFEGRYPERPPLLWVEILSHDDRMVDVWAKAAELVANGVPFVWIIDPETLESELRTATGVQPVTDKTLRLPDSPIVIPLRDVMGK
ncbi:MAG TPA: Uma2 family endonuclease [Bryobacteraceae bacterium]|nr:Uma2 family endonuclease [Bryobacteraceae bacterium]